jgi:hypothetical protein
MLGSSAIDLAHGPPKAGSMLASCWVQAWDASAGVLIPVKPESDVPITTATRSGATCEDAGQHSAQSSVDNCFRDQAVTNARQLADLLSGADVPVVGPTL